MTLFRSQRSCAFRAQCQKTVAGGGAGSRVEVVGSHPPSRQVVGHTEFGGHTQYEFKCELAGGASHVEGGVGREVGGLATIP